MPDEPEVSGLLALMLLVDARGRARTGPDGDLVRLAEQDRGRWGSRADRRGPTAGAGLPAPRPPGPVPDPGGDQRGAQRCPERQDTGWAQIVVLYDQLLAVAPGPVVALHRAVAEVAAARVAWDAALSRTANVAERRLLTCRREASKPTGGGDGARE